MANTAQAKKRARQSEIRRQRNVNHRSKLRTYLKKVVKAISEGNLPLAQTAYKDAVPIIDSMARRGIIHGNKAARHKSRLNRHIHHMVNTAAATG
ncbi:30S ribosomal protein S20 [Gammaproteobacteria bacterium]